MAVNINLDGQAYSFPDWATESTQDQIKDILTAMAKQSGVSDASLKKLLKSTEDMVDQLKDDAKEATKTADEQKKRDEANLKVAKQFSAGINQISEELGNLQDNLDADSSKGFFGRVRSNLEADGEQLGAALGRTAEVFLGAAAGVAATVTGFSGYVFAQLKGAGETINDMTKVGVGFNTTYSELGMSTTQAVGYLGALGVGFEGAAKLIAKNSNVVATQGFGRFNQTMKYAADVSENLGMSFDDSMETFADALSRRQSLINLGNVSQQRVNQTVATTVKMQTAYATALGVSTDELAAFVDSLVRDNGLLTSALLGMSDTVRNDVVAGIEVFASGMASMGGKAGQDIAAAFLEAGSAGAVGLSDAAVGIVTALPQLRGPMNDFVGAIQSGTLSQDDANAMVQGITKDLANLSDSEKQRIQLMARTGDESAKMMANAIAQFEQSEKALAQINKDLGTGFNMDAVQQGTNNFNKIIAQVSGGASNAFYSLFADPGVLKMVEEGLGEILKAFGFGVDSFSGIAQEGGKELGQKFLPMLKSAVGFIVDQLKAVAEYVKSFKDGSGNIDFGALFEDIFDRAKSAIIGSLIKGVALFAVTLFGFSMAKEFAKSILMPQMTKFMGSMFDKAGGAISGLAKKGTGVLAAGMEKASPALSAGIDKIKGSSVGQKVSDKLGGFMSKGEGVTDKLSSSMTGGGSSGGFLAKIADAVKEFGDNKVVKGAASLALLGSALALAAVGFRTFNEVEWKSLVKGTLAIGGLVLLARGLSQGSTAMIKGAAAIAILGASIIPLAAGLRIMNDVGAGTLGVLAGGLIILGAAAGVLGTFLPAMIAGSVAIAALGASIIPLALGLQIMDGVGIDTVGVLAASLVTLGVAAAGMGLALPFILAGAAAITALGVALIPFSAGAAIAGPASILLSAGLGSLADVPFLKISGGILALGTAMTLFLPLIPGLLLSSAALGIAGAALIPFGIGAALAAGPAESLANALALFNAISGSNLTSVAGGLLALGGAMAILGVGLPLLMLAGAAAPSIEKLSYALFTMGMVNFSNLLLAGEALKSLGSGMSALSGGSLMSSLKDGIGSLFGADSPIDKIKKFADTLSEIDVHPLLDVAYGLESMVESSQRLPEVAAGMLLLADLSQPFVDSMSELSRALDKMGQDPFERFATLDTHAESMTRFSTSAEQLTTALDNIDSEYISDGFYTIGDSIQYMVEQMDELNMGDMLKLGAMKLFGPSKEERQAEEQETVQRNALIDTAQEKLYGGLGFDGDGGLTRLLKGLDHSSGKGVREADVGYSGADTTTFALTKAAQLESFGVSVDREAIKAGGETGQSAIADITRQLGTMIDAYKMQEKTGVDQSAVPTVGRLPQTEATPAPTPQQTAQAQVAAANMTPPEQGGPTQTELLQELVRLQAENNRLAKKTRGAIDNIEV